MRYFGFGAALAAAALVLGGAAHAAAVSDLSAFQQKIAARLNSPCDLAESRSIISDPQFAKENGALRSLALANLAYCGDPDAKSVLRRATSDDGAAPLAWNARFLMALRTGDREEALQTLEDAASRKLLNAFSTTSDEVMFSFSQALKTDPTNERRFLVALDQLMWAPPSHFEAADGFWIRLADIYLAEGKPGDAKRVWSNTSTPYAASLLRLANRYEPIRAAINLAPDPVETAKQRLAVDQFFLSQSPRSGLGLTVVSHDLRLLGRADEALKLLDDALAKPGPLMNGRLEYRNWVLNERSSVLYDLGRFDETIQVLRDASVLAERGGANVSQVINLSERLNDLGRSQEALDTLEVLKAADFTSPFWRMYVEANKACAYNALGQSARAAQSLAFTAAHAKDNAQARVQALLCMGDLDAVAAIYIGRLADPALAPGTLIQLSYVRQAARGPGEIELSRRMDLVRGRADVQAAVAKVGHTETFDLIASAMEGYGY